MEKIILVDGNNLLFRSYYATAYQGNFMNNSKGFPTNALYGFVSMINKIINEENPKYMLVAFDKGKTFRHETYDEYKAGRIKMPDELKLQFPVAKELLTYLGIKWFEIDNYEADDIIGTLSKKIDENSDFEGLIVSSDKDLLQLISDKVKVKLLKSKDYVLMDKKVFFEVYGLEPEKMIDIKALQGDSSDNIPGVKGIGEKTALKLLSDYKTLEGIYENIGFIRQSCATKLLENKEMAFKSKELATIYKDVPLNFDIHNTKITECNINKLKEKYEELEFYSFLKNMKVTNNLTRLNIIEVNDINELDNLKSPISFYIELDKTNYHIANILAMSIYDGSNSYYIKKELIKDAFIKIKKLEKYTYDLKKHYVTLKKLNFEIEKTTFDTQIAAYLLNYNIKDDISYLANQFGYNIPFFEIISKAKSIDDEEVKKMVSTKAKFIYDTKNEFLNELEKEDCMYLFNDIEMPLSVVLANMEFSGISVDKAFLESMEIDLGKDLNKIENDIYELVGEKFNISSPKQLGDILFEKLMIGKGKKNGRGYSTDKSILEKYKDRHPVVPLILKHRILSKLQTTYIQGLENSILEDGKIHTIYTQTLTRTGRLSSIEPNLQNIPIRLDYGKIIRKAFLPDDNCLLLSSDYSQIELRVFAHYSKNESFINAFKNDMDIHTKTAMDIFDVKESDVTPTMRRQAKAVNFGILYGISSFGLAEDLGISMKEAKEFIDKYYEKYDGIKSYMKEQINDAYQKGYVTTLMNRKRKLDELKNTNYIIKQQGERMALNTPIQGTSADILKKAMIDIFNEFEKNNIKSKMILQVHDELIFNVLKDEEKIVRKIVEDCMVNVYKLDVPLKVEISVGKNWYEAK